MEEFCPLCAKQGLKKRMKAIQINLEEAVWLCESETCIWPMDYKELEYIPRKIGESWSCYWNTYKVNRPAVTTSESDWQFFITPPYTPKTEVSPGASSDTSSHSSPNVNNLHSIYSKEAVNLLSPKEVSTSSSINEKSNRKSSETNITAIISTHNSEEQLTDMTYPSESNQFSIDRIKSSSLESNNLVSETQLNIIPTFSSHNTKVPTIVSIEKTNLVSVIGKNNTQLIANESSINSSTQEIYKNEILSILPTKEKSEEKFIHDSNLQNSSLENKVEKLQTNNSVKIEDSVITPSSVEVRTVKIDGLPPVTLTYEVPSFLPQTNNVVIKEFKEETKLEPELEGSKKTDSGKSIQSLSKKCIMTSKMYEKFSFSKLRKAKSLQKNEDNKVKTSDSNETSLEAKQPVNFDTKILEPIVEVQDTSSTNLKNLSDDTTSIVKDFEMSETFELKNPPSINRNTSSHSSDSKENIISELDIFLNDFIEENNVNMNESIPSNIVDDDWLSSLLA